MSHIVLLGDSIFDNKSYVGSGGLDVISHIKEQMPDRWKATLCAVDGSVVENVQSRGLFINRYFYLTISYYLSP